jgi:hypothetical protein
MTWRAVAKIFALFDFGYIWRFESFLNFVGSELFFLLPTLEHVD